MPQQDLAELQKVVQSRALIKVTTTVFKYSQYLTFLFPFDYNKCD